MKQMTLFDIPVINNKWQIYNFSADNFTEEKERLALEERLIDLMLVSDVFNRKSISYQLSKNAKLHSWLKYKEGFSADLVKELLLEFNIKAGDTILDPFVGSCTTSLVCQMEGINSIGLDILPMSEKAITAKKEVLNYDLKELKDLIYEIEGLKLPDGYNKKTKYINITRGTYPELTEKEISFFSEWNEKNSYSKNIKNLVSLCILNSLENISYTSKDGQFLRWDYRSKKMIESAKKRKKAGKKSTTSKLDKGVLPSLKHSLVKALSDIYCDILFIQENTKKHNAQLEFISGSALLELPKLDSNILDGVITSPPYCNRYDYTRTYALELAYLGVDDIKIKKLRQDLLSCTVENKTKIEKIKGVYLSLGREKDYFNTLKIIENNKLLKEINKALIERNKNGDINNKGVLRMVENYFFELTFIFSELFRLCKPNSKVAFVNDNVRYGGEVIPVDFISTELASQIGFKPLKIYSLKQQKGNSSQQMAKFGRVPLRKSITIWEKI